MEQPLLSRSDALRYLKCGKRTLSYLVKARILKPVTQVDLLQRPGRPKVWFRQSELDQYLQTRKPRKARIEELSAAVDSLTLRVLELETLVRALSVEPCSERPVSEKSREILERVLCATSA